MDYITATGILVMLTFVMNLVFFTKSLPLFLIRWLHTTTFCFGLLYPFLYDEKYDLFYIILMAMVPVSWWIFDGKCILTTWEKKLMGAEDKDSYDHPFLENLFGSQLNVSLVIVAAQVASLYVIVRYYMKVKSWWLVLVMALFLYVICKRVIVTVEKTLV